MRTSPSPVTGRRFTPRTAAIALSALLLLALIPSMPAAHADEPIPIGSVSFPDYLGHPWDGESVGSVAVSRTDYAAGDTVTVTVALNAAPNSCSLPGTTRHGGGTSLRIEWPSATRVAHSSSDYTATTTANRVTWITPSDYENPAWGINAGVFTADFVLSGNAAALGPEVTYGATRFRDTCAQVNTFAYNDDTVVTPPQNPEFRIVPQDPGQFWFQADDSSGLHEWDFGDGTTSSGFQPIHAYELPGDYRVELCRPASGGQARVCSAQTVTVDAPELGATISMRHDDDSPGTRFELNEEFDVTLAVSAGIGVGDLSDVAFDPPLETLFDGIDQLEVLSGPDPPLPQDALVLAPQSSVSSTWRVKAVLPGAIRLATTLNARDAAGRDLEPLAIEANGMVGGLDVAIVLPDEQVQLVEKTEGERGPDGLLLEPGFEPHDIPVTVRVSVPEDGQEVTQLRLFQQNQVDGMLEIDAVQLIRSGDQPVWRTIQPQPIPMPLQVDSGPEPEMYAGPVQPGESRDFEFVLTVDNPGAFEIAAIAEGVADGTRVTGRGVDVLNVGGEPLLLLRLAVDLRHGHPLPRVEEGQRVRVNGTVQNLSLDETIALDPVRFANEGQGLVIGPVALGDLLPAAGDPGIFAPELGPGESADLILDVSTAVLPGIDGNLLVGRESVVLDTLLSGVVVDADGGERELDAAVEVIYELGNGRHQASGRELLRAEVEPVIAPSRIYDFQTFAFMAGGEAMEQLVQGGAEFFIQLPSVIASLPSAAYQIGSAGASYTAGELKTYSTAVQYMWAWADYQTDLYLGMSTETTEEILQEVTDDLMALYGHQVESREQLKGLVDAAVEGMFTQMIDYRQRAYDASSYGFTEELVAVTAEPFNAIGRTLVEEITGTAVIGWLGKTARSTKVAQDLLQARADRALADAARVADATEDVWRSASNPRVSAAPSTMRGLSASAKVTGQQAVRGWAIDTLSDANLRRLTSKGEGLPVIVAIRSRADETLEWMNTSLGITVKPVTFKPKNVDWRDVQFLGYRDGVGYGIGDRGATALVEPISRERVLANLAAANADDLTYTTVLQRHGQRWKEWYGIECPPGPTCTVPADLSSSAVARLKDKAPVVEIGSNGLAVRKGSLEVPSRGHAPEPADNWDTAGAPAVYDQRRFEMRQITDPEGLGREYWETWLEHSDGSMRRISGDIDIVAVTDTSGRTLSGSSAENVALQLGSLVEAQHPWSSTLNFPEARQSFLDAHRWHPDPARRGEPLLLYMNGEARVGWFDPTKTIDPANPLDAILWLDGGAVDVDDVVRYQRELRGTLADPSDAATPAGHTPGGSSVRKALIDADNTDGGSRLATCSIRTARVGAALYRMSDRSQLERRQDDGSFAPVDVDDACEGGEIVVLPDTATLQDVASGTFTIPIIDELLGIDWRNLFMVGDCVVIAPGTAREESACITAHGSLVLDRPLRFDHPALTQVVMVPAAAVPPATPAPVPEQVTTRPAPPTVAPTGAADVMETLSAMPALRPVVESSASPPDAPDTLADAGDEAEIASSEPNEPEVRDEAAGDRSSDPATSDLTYLLAFVALATLLGLVMLRRRTSAAG